MLKVTIELYDGKWKTLGVAEINNIKGNGKIGHYEYSLQKLRTAWRRGEVYNFPRQELTAWDLLYRVLRKAVGKRND